MVKLITFIQYVHINDKMNNIYTVCTCTTVVGFLYKSFLSKNNFCIRLYGFTKTRAGTDPSPVRVLLEALMLTVNWYI